MEVKLMHIPPENILNKELETIMIASIQTLKRNNKKFGIDEVFQLIKNSKKSFKGGFWKSFIPVNRRLIC